MLIIILHQMDEESDKLSLSAFRHSLNESEFLESLEKINKEYNRKERFLKYYEVIDKSEVPFTIWIPCQLIDREFVNKWLERWDVIPEKVIESIVKRFDYLLFYDTLIRKGCFLPFINTILSIREVSIDDINIICSLIGLKEYQSDFTCFLKELYNDYKYQKNSNWLYSSHHPPIKQLKYIKNLLFLLVNMYKRGNNIFLFEWIILFYDLGVFNITNYNKYQTCMGNMYFLFLVSSIHKYMFYNFLDEYCFRPGLFTIHSSQFSIDLIEELVTLYSKSYIQIGSESILEIFSNIFNNHYNRLNILQRNRILQCINYNICYNNDNDNLFIGFNDLNLELLQKLYIDSGKLDNHISCKVDILLFMVSILEKLDKKITNNKFVYYFVQDLFKLLDDISIFCDLYEELLQSDDQSQYKEQCRSYLDDTHSFITSFSNIIHIEKDKSDSVLFRSEIQKKIIDGCILHINTLYHMKDKYNTIKSNHTLNIVYYMNTLISGILLYKQSDRFNMFMNQCKTSLSSIESELGKNNTEFKRYLHRASIQSEEIDESRLDAITSELLYDPVTLPTSKMVVNRDTIKLHLYENDCDPFTRIKFTESEIDEFMKS